MIFAFRHDSGKLSYVSIVPTYEFAEVTDQNLVNIHLNYELLPPHPFFITPVYLKLQNIVILNTGDMLFAILLKDVFNKNENESSQSEAYKHCYCTYCKSKESEINSNSLHKEEIISKSIEVDGTGQTQNSTDIDSQLNTPEMLSPTYSSHRCAYASYVLQGYTFPNLDDSQESLPSSPFDCTTVMPCQITSYDCNEQLKLTYEHRCFKSSDKGKDRQFVMKFQVSH